MPGTVTSDASGDYLPTLVHKAPQKPLVSVVHIGNVVFTKVAVFSSSKDRHNFVLYHTLFNFTNTFVQLIVILAAKYGLFKPTD